MDDQDIGAVRSFREEIERLLKGGLFPEAEALAETRLQRLPSDPEARIALCRIRIGQGRLDEACERVDDLEDLLESLAQVYACLGDLYRREGREDLAEPCDRRFALLSPRSLPGEAKRAPESEAEEETTLPETEPSPQAPAAVPPDFQTLTLADLYLRQGHLVQAEEVLEAILKREPGHPQAAERLEALRERVRREEREKRLAPVIDELNRWLSHIGRLRPHEG